MDKALEGFFETDEIKIASVFEEHEAMVFLCTEIVGYLVKIQAIPTISVDDKRGSVHDARSCHDLKRVDDHALSIANYAQDRRDNRPEFSTEAIAELKDMSKRRKPPCLRVWNP